VRIVVGVSPDESGEDAVALGAVLSRLLDAQITLAYVHPPTIDYPSIGHVDAEWRAFLEERADSTLGAAAVSLALEWDISDIDQVVLGAASVGHGLRTIAEDAEASIVVLGPGSRAVDGHIAMGPIAHSLLHGGPSAVALAPEGYRETAPERFARLVVGFQDTPETGVAVAAAVQAARPRSLPVHLLTVVIRATRIVGSRLGRDPERLVMETLVEHEQEAQRQFMAHTDYPLHGTVVQGDTAERAMSRFDWEDSDLLVLASSRLGAVRRVFLGDLSHKLMRASAVPAIVLPRKVDSDALAEAIHG
jgi:nucleotide-binding universal stress UspA family protein